MKRSNNTGTSKWAEYERRKKKLIESDPDPAEYNRRLREICKELKI